MAAGCNERRLELKDLSILRRLGQGHSGYLYETEWGGKKCARKDFPLGSVELNRKFETEAQPLLDLDHPNIVKCFGYTLGKSSCSLVQEYVGENLQNTIQSRIDEQRKTSSRSTSTGTRVLGVDEIKRLVSSRIKKETATTNEGSSRCLRPTPFEGPEAISIIAQIASAMECLHGNQVAHGDLKPRNVLMYSESGEWKVKLAGFGLSEIKKRITLVSEHSRHVETLTWKAPECLEEGEEILGPTIGGSDDDRDRPETDSAGEGGDFERSRLAMADVYSFGLTCSYIVGGKLMSPDMSLTKLRERRVGDWRPKLPSACHESLKSMIDSCLEFDPCSRPTFTTICDRVEFQQWVTKDLSTKTITEEWNASTSGSTLSSCMRSTQKQTDFHSKKDHDSSNHPYTCDKEFASGQSFGAHMNIHRNKISSRSSTPPDSQSMMDIDGSLYKGVRYRKEMHKWVAEIRPPQSYKTWWLGTYLTPEEAAYAYDVAIKCLGIHGPLNFEGNQIYHQIPQIATDLRRQAIAATLRNVV